MDWGLYAYGVVRPGVDIPVGTTGVAGAAVDVAEIDSLGVVVSPIDGGDLHARRDDLLAHSDVLQRITEQTDVLPMSFGCVFADRKELADTFIAPNRDALSRLLDRIGGHVEFQIKGSYVQQAVLVEIAATDAKLKKLQARARSSSSVEAQIEVGRRVATLLDDKRYGDARSIADTLRPLAADLSIADAQGEYGVINASFLVPRGSAVLFIEKAERLQEDLGDRVSLRCLGPLPPYSFVSAEELVGVS
ncbi:MAG: GvpL/GvpF family gas vesicle protein [Actinomycetota bacterium]|nr:GvpL/GvpF family gas vesicle protein [Actinomycetota bacterium]